MDSWGSNNSDPYGNNNLMILANAVAEQRRREQEEYDREKAKLESEYQRQLTKEEQEALKTWYGRAGNVFNIGAKAGPIGMAVAGLYGVPAMAALEVGNRVNNLKSKMKGGTGGGFLGSAKKFFKGDFKGAKKTFSKNAKIYGKALKGTFGRLPNEQELQGLLGAAGAAGGAAYQLHSQGKLNLPQLAKSSYIGDVKTGSKMLDTPEKIPTQSSALTYQDLVDLQTKQAEKANKYGMTDLQSPFLFDEQQ